MTNFHSEALLRLVDSFPALPATVNKVIAVSLNSPNAPLLEMVIRCIFQETGKMPVHYSPDCGEFFHRVEARWGKPHGEAIQRQWRKRHSHW